jgi:hypothetical protein
VSDRSSLQVLVYAVADEDRTAVSEILAAHDLRPDWDGETSAPLVLGTCYGAHESPLGEVRELVHELLEQAPSAAFEAWQDPHPTADGEYLAHVPGVGMYFADCDAQGNPHADVTALTEHLAGLPAGTTVHAWLAADDSGFLGIAVRTSLKQHRDALPQA